MATMNWVGPRSQMTFVLFCLGCCIFTLGQSKATRLKLPPGAHLGPELGQAHPYTRTHSRVVVVVVVVVVVDGQSTNCGGFDPSRLLTIRGGTPQSESVQLLLLLLLLLTTTINTLLVCRVRSSELHRPPRGQQHGREAGLIFIITIISL